MRFLVVLKKTGIKQWKLVTGDHSEIAEKSMDEHDEKRKRDTMIVDRCLIMGMLKTTKL